MQTIKFKYNFYFYKKGLLIFISHLDLMRLFERVIKKSQLPILYSQGFNPHMKFSLPFPLSLGFEGQNEIGEIYLEKIVPEDDIKQSLNQFLPEDVQVIKVEKDFDKKSLVNNVLGYQYKIVAKKELDKQKIDQVLNQDEIIVEKTNKKGKLVRNNLKEYLGEYSIDKKELSFKLIIKDGKTIKADQLMKVLDITLDDIDDVVRDKVLF